MLDLDELQRLGEAMSGWQNLKSSWPADESETDWEVGQVSEDDNRYPVMTINTDQYDCPGDASTLAQYYAAVHPAAVLSLITEVNTLRQAADGAAKKLRSAEICHPRAVEQLVDEARAILGPYLPAGWPAAALEDNA